MVHEQINEFLIYVVVRPSYFHLVQKPKIDDLVKIFRRREPLHGHRLDHVLNLRIRLAEQMVQHLMPIGLAKGRAQNTLIPYCSGFRADDEPPVLIRVKLIRMRIEWLFISTAILTSSRSCVLIVFVFHSTFPHQILFIFTI